MSIGNSFKFKNTHIDLKNILTAAEKKYLIYKKTDDKDNIK
jgi:hypothetical protein